MSFLHFLFCFFALIAVSPSFADSQTDISRIRDAYDMTYITEGSLKVALNNDKLNGNDGLGRFSCLELGLLISDTVWFKHNLYASIGGEIAQAAQDLSVTAITMQKFCDLNDQGRPETSSEKGAVAKALIQVEEIDSNLSAISKLLAAYFNKHAPK